jgi:hypothetical protein
MKEIVLFCCSIFPSHDAHGFFHIIISIGIALSDARTSCMTRFFPLSIIRFVELHGCHHDVCAMGGVESRCRVATHCSPRRTSVRIESGLNPEHVGACRMHEAYRAFTFLRSRSIYRISPSQPLYDSPASCILHNTIPYPPLITFCNFQFQSHLRWWWLWIFPSGK